MAPTANPPATASLALAGQPLPGEAFQQGERPIIRDVFQILIRNDGKLPAELPPHAAANVRSVRDSYPHARHHLLDATQLRGFLTEHFPGEVLAAYDTLAPYSYKCDLARYCLLYIHGGLYVDIGIRLLTRFRPPAGKRLATFRDLWGSGRTPWGLSNGILFATQGAPELLAAINRVVEHCRTHHYGDNPLDPTGPSMFGKVIAAAGDLGSYWIGEARAVTPEFDNKNLVFMTPDGELVALITKAKGGDLTDLGLSQTNNYNTIWHAGKVYGEQGGMRSFAAGRLQTEIARITPDGFRIDRGMIGCAVYGPYISVDSGRYTIALRFDPATVLGRATIDICANVGRDVVKLLPAGSFRADTKGTVTFPFDTARDLRDVEIRLVVKGDTVGRFIELTIEPRP